MNEAEDQVMLVEKLARIAGEMDYIEKKGFNKFQNYAFAREADFKAKLKPLLAREGIWMGVECFMEGAPICLGTSKSEVPQWMTTVKLVATFRYGQAELVASSIGQGVDSGDKQVYKAIAGGLKYLIASSFQVETGDDPENENDLDKGHGVPPTAPQAPATPSPTPTAPRPQAPSGAPPPMNDEEYLKSLEFQLQRLGTDSVVKFAEKFEAPSPMGMPQEKRRQFLAYLRKVEPR